MSKKSIFVRSTAHTGLTLMEPNPNPEKPGEAAPLRSFTLASSGRPGVAAVTELTGDEAEAFEAWAKENKNGDLMRSGVISVGENDQPEEKFGHEAFLKGAKGSGSTEKAEAGKVKAQDMTEKGPGKPNDGPGEPRKASQPGEAEPKTAASVAPVGEPAKK